MIGGKPVYGLITARGGSKRLPGKNLLAIGGKPMIDWTIQAAQSSRYIDRFVLSSDSTDIINRAKYLNCDVPFVRPDSLATDTTTSEAVTQHALDKLGWRDGYLVLLQPTSPFRNADDIDKGVRLCEKNGAPAVVGITAPEKPSAWTLTMDNQNQLLPVWPDAFKGHCKAPQVVYPNGALFIVDIVQFLRAPDFWPTGTIGLMMPPERSIDIDDADDLYRAEAQFQKDHNTAQQSR